jgi:Arc/MetJ-type ribon-helix-helix transcriptional regulator
MAMPRSIHVRLDEASAAALGLLRAEGLSDSEAVRVALREASDRRRARAALVAEARALAADRADLAEARAVRELMAELAPEASD